MPHPLRATKLTAVTCAMLWCTASALSAPPAPAADAVQLALQTAPNTRVTVARTAVHVVSYDMNHTLMSLLGNRVAPTTLIDSRTATIDVSADGARIIEDATVLRKFGGTDPKDKSVVTRHDRYEGALARDGVRTPPVARLGDAGDGALDELPAAPLRVGQTWTFSRPIGLDRTLGDGTMTYTDTIAGLSERSGHRIASITVSGVCEAQPASDLQAKGFHPSTYTLRGTAEFDVTAGLPGVQHYDGQVEWIAHVMFSKIGIKFADTYDSSGWTLAGAHR